MRELGHLLIDFLHNNEFACYYADSISFTIRRFVVPPYHTLGIRVEFNYYKEGFHIVDAYVVYSDDLTRKVYWKEYANSNIFGPFDTYDTAVMSLECYLMTLYGDVIWWDSSEIKLDFNETETEE